MDGVTLLSNIFVSAITRELSILEVTRTRSASSMTEDTEETHKFRAVHGLPMTPVTTIRFVDPTSGTIFAQCTSCGWRLPFIKLLSSGIGLYKLVQTFTEATTKKVRDATPAKYNVLKYDSTKR
jgi:hypothetical protein